MKSAVGFGYVPSRRMLCPGNQPAPALQTSLSSFYLRAVLLCDLGVKFHALSALYGRNCEAVGPQYVQGEHAQL
jgi:hypothetical protein